VRERPGFGLLLLYQLFPSDWRKGIIVSSLPSSLYTVVWAVVRCTVFKEKEMTHGGA